MTDTKVKEKGHLRKHWDFYVLLVLSIISISYVWFTGRYDNHKMSKEHQANIERIRTTADSLLQVSLTLDRMLTAKTMGLAISSMSNDEKSQYFEQLVKYKGVDEIAFESDNKVILATSNAKYQNYSVFNAFDIKINYQNTDTQSFLKKGKNIVAHPVIREGKIDGTLVIVFPSVSVTHL